MSDFKFDPIGYLVEQKVRSPLSNITTREQVLALEEKYRALSPEQLRLRVKSFEGCQPIDELSFVELSRESDLKFWSVCPDWSAEQAVALSFGKMPKFVDWDIIQVMGEFSNIATAYLDRRDLVRRSMVAGLLPDPVPPAAFVVWARRAGIVLPQNLESAVQERALELVARKGTNEIPPTQERAGEAADPRPTESGDNVQELRREIVDLRTRLQDAESRIATEKRSATREKGTILKLFVGLAAATYGYDPRDDGDKPTSEIVNDLAGRGLRIDPKTVRKYLEEGGDMLLGQALE